MKRFKVEKIIFTPINLYFCTFSTARSQKLGNLKGFKAISGSEGGGLNDKFFDRASKISSVSATSLSTLKRT